MPLERYTDFRHVMRADGIVHGLLRSGATMDDIVTHLANDKLALLARIEELEQIAPKKIRVGNKVFVYRCPDDLIPETK